MPDVRADVELVRRGLARSRRHAAALVAAGRVRAGGRALSKPSTPVPADASLDVAVDADDPQYASRAGLKLAGALEALAADPVGRALAGAVDGAWCLDLGASTGGFTDVLLRRGAAHVVALDVGHGQLVPGLRSDARVTVVEGFNVRDLTPQDLSRAPDVVVGDLSFISLTLVLPAVAGVLPAGATALLLIKPQFEVGRERLGSGGVVRDAALRADAVRSVLVAARAAGLGARALVPSPVPGPSGNREYFCWFERPGGGDNTSSPEVGADDVGATVAAAVGWEPDEGAVPPVVPLPPLSVPPVPTPGGAS